MPVLNVCLEDVSGKKIIWENCGKIIVKNKNMLIRMQHDRLLVW